MRRFAGLTLIALAFLAPAHPSIPAEEPKKADGPTVQVPYRLTDTKHVLVRVKINGQGPFHFIVDSGAPSLFVGTKTADKLGIVATKNGWAGFDRFEIEGGLVLEKVRGRVEDVFQLESMNKTGLAGAELHGIIGYNVLARFRLTFDLTKDKMAWQRLDFEPKVAETATGKNGVDAVGGLVKNLGNLKLERGLGLRGFLGVELAEKDGAVTVAGVWPASPAAEAKLQVGDRLTHVHAKAIKTAAEAHRLIAPWAAGDEIEMTILRDGKSRSVRATLGKGL